MLGGRGRTFRVMEAVLPRQTLLESNYEKVYDYGIDFIVQWMYNSTNEEHGDTKQACSNG